ncbi:MAG: polysaccharide biosynthesis protein [Lachnospiraceae bacterium]|nr:polysaccharide biosynthesis protein [Lachnospiraceae bacterium]
MSGTNEKRQVNQRNNFLVQGSILAIAGIIVRIIGMVYRIPLTNIIGDRGNSLYDSAYSAYSIILIISSYSLPVAISKLIAAKNSKHEYVNANRVFKASLLYAAVVGLIASIICFAFAPWLVKADGAVPVLRVLAPVIFFSAILGTFRGLFQGQGTMVPTSVSQIFEQIFNAIVSVLAAFLLVRPFIKNDPDDLLPTRGAMGSTLGTGAGVLAGLVFVAFVFFLYLPMFKQRSNKGQRAPIDSYGVILKSIILTVTPMVLSATLYNVSPFIDNYMIFAVMEKLGYAQPDIQSMHGIYTGKYLLMVNIPVAIANALSSAMLPNLAAAKARGDSDEIISKSQITIKVTMMIAIPCTVGLAVLGGPVIQLIFGRSIAYPDLAGRLLLFGSGFVLFFALSTVTNAILQATDHLNLPVIHSSIALVIHTILAFVFMRAFNMNVWGLMFSTIAFAFVLCVLNIIALRRKVGFRMEWKKTFAIPLLASAFMGIMCWGGYYVVHYFTGSNAFGFIVAFIMGVITYFVALLLFDGVTEQELENIPKGHLITKVLRKLNIFE